MGEVQGRAEDRRSEWGYRSGFGEILRARSRDYARARVREIKKMDALLKRESGTAVLRRNGSGEWETVK